MLALNFCLPKFEADKFLEKLSKGEINPFELAELDTAGRHSFFEGFMSKEQAKAVNTLFESKLLLKNQQAGLIRWAQQVTGLKPRAKTELIDRINRMDEALLTPESEQAFLADLAEQKLGVGVSMEEATKISDLAEEVANKKANMQSGGDRLEYGRSRVAFDNYVENLKQEAKPKFESVGQVATDVAGTAKALKTTLDLSAIFRQGYKTMLTHPKIWLKQSMGAFKDAVREFGGEAVMDEIKADIVSRPNYDLYRKAKLAIGVTEEAYPVSFPGRVPLAGRAFKASETAFTGFQYKNRVDIFDKYIKIAEKSGVDITDAQQLESIGKLTNSLTGRGSLGKEQGGSVERGINNAFFSPRNLKSHIDVLTAHVGDRSMTSFARKQAAFNLMKIIAGSAGILYIADMIAPDSVEWDPRSADFGKIRIGDTRFDVTGGMSSIPTLAARLITSETKSSTSGKVRELNSGLYGADTKADVIWNFFENKLSPVGQVFDDIAIAGETFEGEKPTVGNQLENLLVPLPITNYQELRDNPKSANMLVALIADALGIGTNTYSK